jgi:hypothetical protein
MAGAEGAYYNVLINVESLKGLDQDEDPDFLPTTLAAARKALARCEELATGVRAEIKGKLEDALAD